MRILVLFLAFLGTAPAGAAPGERTRGEPALLDRVVAVVNNEVVTRLDLDEQMKVALLQLRRQGKDTNDRSTFDGLLANADVFITAQRGAALERLQLAGDALSTSFSRLCHIGIVGEEGSEIAGHDLTYLADAGLATPPHLPATLLADLAGAERAVTASFAALRLAQLTGRGQHIVVSLGHAARAFAGPMTHGLTSPGGLLAGAHPGYNFYRARDGWVVLAALEPHFVERVKRASGTKFTVADLQQFFAQKTIAEWKIWASAHDIPLSVISDPSSA